MFLISKIIFKEWMKSLIGSILVLFLLITVGDIINGFMRGYNFNYIVLNYFLKLPELLGKLLPIACLISSLFALNKLKNQAELMAILASGFSATRIYTLVFFFSLTIGTFQLLNLGFIQPHANKIKRNEFEKSRKNESKYLARSKVGSSGLLWYKSDNYFTSFKAFDRKNKSLRDIKIYIENNKGHLQQVYAAKNATFVEDKNWKLFNVTILNMLDDKRFPQTSFQESMNFPLKEVPQDFDQFESDITTLPIHKLARFVSRLELTGINTSEYKIMLYEKYSLALICIIFSLIPVSVVFNPNRRSAGFGKSVVFALVFTIGFWLLYSGSISMGTAGKLPPLLSTMGIPLIFIAYILFTINKNRSL
jgi:LPS export ABC transporter permease LptG